MFTDEALLSPDFDETGYLRHALQVSSTSFDAEQTRLSRCLEKIETEIHATVQTHRDALIGSVQEVSTAQKTTNAILATVDQLSSSVRRMKHGVHEPYVQMEQRVHELRNVYSCLSLVRNVQRYLSVATKLRDSADGDLVRAARLLKETEEIQNACDFSGIPFVDSIAPAVAHAANTVRTRLNEALRSAIHNSNPSELAVALQCSASMGALTKTVQGLLAEIKREASRAIVKELDNASSLSGNDMDASFRDAIFLALERALGQVAVQLRAFGHLWAVLRKRKDPSMDVSYWFQLPISEQRNFPTVWTSIMNQIKERLTKLSKRGAALVAVSSEYGRLTLQLRSFFNSLRETISYVFFDGEETIDDAIMNATIEESVQKLSNDFEPRFRLALQDRLRERMAVVLSKIHTIRPTHGAENTPIMDVRADIRLQQQSLSGAAAGARNAPAMVLHPVASPIDPKSFFKTVSNEISVARSDDAVLAVVLRAVTDEIETFYKRCNDSLKALPVPDLPKVSGTQQTASQLFHIQIANAASTFVMEMQNVAALFPFSTSQTSSSSSSSSMVLFEQSLINFSKLSDNLSKFVSQVSQPYFNAAKIVLLQNIDNFVSDYYEKGITRPHQNALATSIKSRITDFAARYALLFDSRSGTVCARSCLDLADALLQRFVARMLLLRRSTGSSNNIFSDQNQQQYRSVVAEDCTAMQEAINILHPLDRLARRLSQLRAVRSLTLATSSEADFDRVLGEHLTAKFHPLVILLSVIQTIPPAAAPSLMSQLKLSNQNQLVGLVENLLAVGVSVASSTISSANELVRETSQWKVMWEACHSLISGIDLSSSLVVVDGKIVSRTKRILDVLKQ